jgi:hypothetical protein
MEVMTSDQVRRALDGLTGEIFARYVLWDLNSGLPVYVGTAKTASRIRVHLKKDSPEAEQTAHLKGNDAFHRFVKSQKAGWLGVSFDLFGTDEEAKRDERALIERFGLRSAGGQLFNRRMGG